MRMMLLSDYIKSLEMLCVLCDLADWILDPFSQLDGSDIDG